MPPIDFWGAALFIGTLAGWSAGCGIPLRMGGRGVTPALPCGSKKRRAVLAGRASLQ
jgi:hypothetical protein